MKHGRFFVSVALTIVLAMLAIEAGSVPSQANFDGDKYADLAIGVSGEDLGGVTDAGVVSIMYGSYGSGLRSARDQIWDQNQLSADPNGAEDRDYFGQKLAVGDLNGDGAMDLAVGVFREDVGNAIDAGAVHIIYGDKGLGLQAAGNQLWTQASPGIQGGAESYDQLGQALAIGDFDGDGFDDLAVAAPKEDVGSVSNAGAVNVIYGSHAGLTGSGDQIFYEGYEGVSGSPEADDWFGKALAAGDFDADGYADLVISVPGEDLGGVSNAGRVVVLYGAHNGLSANGQQTWKQGSGGVKNIAETNDYFGSSLATGDFDGDGFADLAIGTPDEDSGLISDSGLVNVLYGSSTGLTAAGNETWWDEGREAGDRFGSSLAAGDFDGDGFDELAVGAPGEDLNGFADAGAVDSLYGASDGLHRRLTTGYWHQDRSQVLDNAEEGDHFGYALAAGDFNNDGNVDLAVGVCHEDIASKGDAGAVQVLYGSSQGITATDNQFWHQDVPGMKGAAEANDHFGCALAAFPHPQKRVFMPLMLLDH